MILYCVTLYLGNLCFSSQRSGPYFAVFSSLFCIHGQLISSTATVSFSLSTIVASILLAFTTVLSAYKGMYIYIYIHFIRPRKGPFRIRIHCAVCVQRNVYIYIYILNSSKKRAFQNKDTKSMLENLLQC